MAIFVIYQKSAENETEVHYRYGDSEENLNRHLVIDTTGPIGRPKVCPDGLGEKVIARLNWERTMEWPESGLIQG